MRQVLIAAICLLLAQAAVAQEFKQPLRRFLISGGLGQAEVSHGGYSSELMGEAQAEYYFTKHFGIALGGRKLDDRFEFEGLSKATIELESAWEIAFVGEYPVNRHFTGYASLGRLSYELKARAHDRVIGEDSGGALSLGLGARFYISNRFGAYARIHRAYDVSETDLQFIGLGGFFRF